MLIEAPGDGGVALRTATLGGHPVVQDAVPVTLDQRLAAARAEGRAALGIVHVADRSGQVLPHWRQERAAGTPACCHYAIDSGAHQCEE